MVLIEWRVSFGLLVKGLAIIVVSNVLTLPSASLMAMISTMSTWIIWPSSPIMVMIMVTRLFSSNFFSLNSTL